MEVNLNREGPEPEAEYIEPALQPEPTIDPNERATWEGRVKAENAKVLAAEQKAAELESANVAYRRNLNAAGYDLSSDGSIVPLAQYGPPGNYPPQPAPEPEWDPYDPAMVDRRVEALAEQKAKQIVAQAIQVERQRYGPVVSETAEAEFAAAIPDWEQIRGEFINRAKTIGVTDLDEVRTNKAAVALFADAARSSVAAKTPTGATGPSDEEARQSRLAAGAAFGGAAGAPPRLEEYADSEEVAELTRDGAMSREQAVALLSGPAVIRPKAKK